MDELERMLLEIGALIIEARLESDEKMRKSMKRFVKDAV